MGGLFMNDIIASELDFDGTKVVEDLNRLLRLRTTPIGMKLFTSREEMSQIPRIRRPGDIHTTDQIVGQCEKRLDRGHHCRRPSGRPV